MRIPQAVRDLFAADRERIAAELDEQSAERARQRTFRKREALFRTDVRDRLDRLEALDERLTGLEADLAARSESLSEVLLRMEHIAVESAVGLHPRRNKGVDQTVQHLMRMHVESLIADGRPLPAFADVEARFYSQNGEDGIIQLLLAAVGTDTRRAVEICAGDGVENNSTNLIVNHGWTALLVDGGEELLTVGKRFYEHNTDTWYWPPTLRREWITRDGINDIVRSAGFDGDIDLLTVDVDGMDYWIWQALDCVNPRIVVTEYNAVWAAHESKTLRYRDDFVWEKGSLNFGASLGALVKLAKSKGYRLVGGNRYGFNAFFVREDLAPGLLPEVDPESLMTHPGTAASRAAADQIDLDLWVDV